MHDLAKPCIICLVRLLSDVSLLQWQTVGSLPQPPPGAYSFLARMASFDNSLSTVLHVQYAVPSTGTVRTTKGKSTRLLISTIHWWFKLKHQPLSFATVLYAILRRKGYCTISAQYSNTVSLNKVYSNPNDTSTSSIAFFLHYSDAMQQYAAITNRGVLRDQSPTAPLPLVVIPAVLIKRYNPVITAPVWPSSPPALSRCPSAISAISTISANSANSALRCALYHPCRVAPWA